MSIAAMNWVWRQALPPTPKLVLMSLADAADDQGACWPSVATIACKCCVSTRTVRRIMQDLVAANLLSRESRLRHDRSHSSNRYVLPLGGGDKLSGGTDVGVSTPGHLRQEGTDTRVSPRTTKESKRKPPQPQASVPTAPARETTGVVSDNTSGDTAPKGVVSDNSGGDDPDRDWFEYPKELSEPERVEARRKLAALPDDLAQQLLDELAGRMKAGAVRVAPLAYLRGLIQRARAGDFTPEAALEVADARQRRRSVEAALRQAEAVRSETVKLEALAATNASDNPLVRRLNAIRHRHNSSGKVE
jgi:Helix-turn-helix domain